MKRILTIQDISCVGQCSLTVALPIISAFGIETSVLPSAVLSTHTGGFQGFTFRDLTDDFPKIIEHWKKENIKFDGFYTGYIGNANQIDFILELFNNFGNNGAKRIVDPAMADFGKMYSGFDKSFVKDMARLVSNADCALPNITESALLCNIEYQKDNHSDEYIKELCQGILDLGAKSVVLKGVKKGNQIGVVTFDGKEIQYFMHEKVERNMHGTGDVYASCFTGASMCGANLIQSAQISAELTLSAIKHTLKEKDHWYGVNFECVIPEITNFIQKNFNK